MNKALKIALTLGSMAGMRSMTAPATLSNYFVKNKTAGESKAAQILSSPAMIIATNLMALGELVVDKSPQIPARITPIALVGRAASGAISGAAIYKHENRKPWSGALIGGAVAVVSTFVTYYLRRKLKEAPYLDNTTSGIIEDVAVVGSGATMALSV